MFRPAMTIKITPNDKGNPPGKLAEAEVHFGDGPMEGLKLIGFSIWERRGGGGRNARVVANDVDVAEGAEGGIGEAVDLVL